LSTKQVSVCTQQNFWVFIRTTSSTATQYLEGPDNWGDKMFDFRRITLFVWDTDSQSTRRLLFKKFGGHGLCAPHILVKPLGPFFAVVHNILWGASFSDSEKKYHFV